MKKFLLASILLIIGHFSAFSQPGQITGYSILPGNPDETDTVYALIDFSVNSMGCPLQSHSVNNNAGTFEVVLNHCAGMLPAICSGTDTIELGVLTAGNYNLLTMLNVGFGIGGPCSSFSAADTSAPLPFTVSTVTGITPEITSQITILPGSGVIRVLNLAQLTGDLRIIDLSGRMIYFTGSLAGKTELVYSLNPGHYIVQYSSTSGISYPKKVFVAD